MGRQKYESMFEMQKELIEDLDVSAQGVYQGVRMFLAEIVLYLKE